MMLSELTDEQRQDRLYIHKALTLFGVELVPQIRGALIGAGKHPSIPFVFGGGCFRDYLCGADIKDIDVFVSHQGEPGERERSDDDYGELYGPVQQIGMAGGQIPIEMITRHPDIGINLDAVSQRFDIGLCQIVMDSQGRFYMSDHAWNDYINKTLTVLRLNSSKSKRDRVEKRLKKITDKIPGLQVDWSKLEQSEDVCSLF